MTRLEARALTFGYGPGAPVLRELNFEAVSGELLILAGANGSGKSTLLGLLAGLLQPEAGELLVNGAGGRAAREFLRRSSALLPQNIDHWLLGETGREDLTLGLNLKEAGAAEFLDDLIRHWDLAPFLDRPVETLSLGQKKRLALAAALARRPAAVFLDEPLAGLDWPGLRAALADLARLKAAGVVTVLVTHEPALVAGLADRWLLLKNGGEYLFGRDLARHFEAYGLRPSGL
ncbi:MAG: ATP-binding cassette domain-containing protein [Candidatus Adiutrix sp.]|nr:ATP-binding cassette domain-containing protein [Candidatus Adiutrix sp.]